MNQFFVCTSCRSHVRDRDPVCPFCRTVRSLEAHVTRFVVARRMSRGKLLAVGSTLAMTACTGTHPPSPSVSSGGGSGGRRVASHGFTHQRGRWRGGSRT
jgi:hypothetical protein